MLKKNTLNAKLAKGDPVLGTWNTLASPLVTEVLAESGLDFQIIDLEHGPFILDKLHLHVNACENSSLCTPLVRIPSKEDWMVLQALDQGAHGVVVPHISNIQEAKELVKSTKYYPNSILNKFRDIIIHFKVCGNSFYCNFVYLFINHK